jgi:hypothetical protein
MDLIRLTSILSSILGVILKVKKNICGMLQNNKSSKKGKSCLQFFKGIYRDTISTDVTLTRYLLWTRDNAGNNEDQVLLFNNLTSIQESNFVGPKPTKIIVHGYSDHGKTGWVTRVKDAYLKKGMYYSKKALQNVLRVIIKIVG